MDKEKPEGLEGLINFHSETGTEGGYWAFQDKRFITPNTRHFSCTKCGLYWDKNRYARAAELEVHMWGKKWLGNSPLCQPGKHIWQLVSPENWSYDGLHILEDGDCLIIYDKENQNTIIWEGLIRLKQFEAFTESAYGLWIHADQEGIDREVWAKWFFDQHPACLIKKCTPEARS